MIQMKLLTPSDASRWDETVARFANGTIFHTMAWLETIARLRRAKVFPFGIFEGSELVGVFPLLRLRRGPLTVLASPLGAVGYGGPLVSRAHYPAVLALLDAQLLPATNADYVELRSLEPFPPSLLAGRHYTVETLQTCVVPLSPQTQTMWRRLKGACRTAVRQAWKNGVKIIEAQDGRFAAAYHRMSADTYGKANRPPPLSANDYRLVWEMLHPHNRIKVFLAEFEERIVAGGIFLHFNGKVYFWDGAAFRAYYHTRANNLLHWTVMEWAAECGMTEYDMLGANLPGIAKFKQSFGGELRSYTYAYKDATWLAGVGRRAYLWVMPRLRRMQVRLAAAKPALW
ncbi:MAG: GNAT family N-acetyltransferase [Caldilineae bacterium]|nr:MAG: GNAT family N-acetyltransferase [Caldilineae bacterium]